MSAQNSYTYKPLQSSTSIRLLILLPGAISAVLRLRLRVIDRESPDVPSFEAISYVWGRPDPLTTVEILDEENDGLGHLKITPNLAAALCRFRNPDAERTLWADAICINQNDVTERNQQVQNMARIYTGASTVLIWLKEETTQDDSVRAYDYIFQLAEFCVSNKEFSQIVRRAIPVFQSTRLSSAEHCAHFGLPDGKSLEFRAFLQLAQNTWFSRVWTSQESFLARDKIVHTGLSLQTPGMLMSRAFLVLQTLTYHSSDTDLFPATIQNAATKSWSFRHRFGGPEGHLTLSDLLQHRRGSGCEDDRDLVYALVSAVEDSYGIHIDYAIPFETVFTRSAFKIMCHDKSFNIIGMVERPRAASNLSSWVPDWRYNRPGTAVHTTGFRAVSNHKYAATGSAIPNIELINDRILKASGITLLSVTDITSMPSIPSTDHRVLKVSGTTHLSLVSASDLPMIAAEVQLEDLIVLLIGGKVPIVLRSSKSNKGFYTYVCECFLGGFMQGEGLIRARVTLDSGYNNDDREWLNRLHEEPLPIPTEVFYIE